VTENNPSLLDEQIKAQLERAKAANRPIVKQLEQLGAASPSLALSPAVREILLRQKPRSPEAKEASEAAAAWRQDIANREQDIAGRKDGLRQLERWIEREFGIPAPRPAPAPAVNQPAAAAAPVTNDNDNPGQAAEGAPTPAPTPLRRKPGPAPTSDWPLIVAREMIRIVLANEDMPTASEMCERVYATCNYLPEIRPMQKLMKQLLAPLPKS
jgi:hypothetical protein